MKFILASGSPRRRELLAAEGFEFETVVPSVLETASDSLTIRELTIGNATCKALAIARAHPRAVVLGADTLVALDGRVLGKPRDLAQATEFLRRLSGREHEVCTGVFLCRLTDRASLSFAITSGVRFHSLGNADIRAYFAKVDPLDKAGAYAAQGHGADIIQCVRGSYSNVVGLPMQETARALRRFGICARPVG